MDDAFFAENTLIEVNVPEDPHLDIESALSAPEPEAGNNVTSLVPSIPQRSVLYFDEKLPIFVVVRVPREDETALRARISRLVIGVEAHVQNETDASPLKEGSAQTDMIWSGKVNTAEEPVVVVEDSEDEDLSTALLLWKLTATLSRPRIRIPAPVLVWVMKGTLDLASRARAVQRSRYLPSGVPLSTNLLASLRDDYVPNSKMPYLSSGRLSANPANKDAQPPQVHDLRTLDKAPFRALPALSSRVRFHRSHKFGDLPTITASLELEFPPYATSEIDVLAVRLNLQRGKAIPLGNEHMIILPKTCHGRDSLVWLYTLSPLQAFEDPAANASPVHLLEVEIEARAVVSDICRPLVDIKWKTNVDFSSASNTLRGSLASLPLRPPSQARPENDSERPNSRTSIDTAKPSIDSPEFTITFAPKGAVYVGESFKWGVTVVNRSSRHRQISLTTLQKRKRQSGKRHSHQSSTGSVTAVSKSGAIADAAVDENLLFATVKSSGPDVAHLVSMDADVRVGPLAPGAAAAVELEFLPLVEGYLQPDAIRIMDVASNEFCDIRQLPSIVAITRIQLENPPLDSEN